MMEKLTFALYQYSLLGIFAIAVYGLGRPMTGWFMQSLGLSKFLMVPLTLASGMGIAMIALFVAGVLGYLNVTVIALLVLVGIGAVIASSVADLPRLGICGSIVKDLRWVRMDT